MRTLVRLLPLALAAALAGCGQAPTSANDFKGADKAVAQTIEDLQSNAQGRKPVGDLPRRALDRAGEQAEDVGQRLRGEIEKLTGDADDFELEVTDVTVTGNTATARSRRAGRDDKNAVDDVLARQEDGDWRLSTSARR